MFLVVMHGRLFHDYSMLYRSDAGIRRQHDQKRRRSEETRLKGRRVQLARPSIDVSCTSEGGNQREREQSIEGWIAWFCGMTDVGLKLLSIEHEQTDVEPIPTNLNLKPQVKRNQNKPCLRQPVGNCTGVLTTRRLQLDTTISGLGWSHRTSLYGRISRNDIQPLERMYTEAPISDSHFIPLQLGEGCPSGSTADFSESIYREMRNFETLSRNLTPKEPVKKGREKLSTFDYNGQLLQLQTGDFGKRRLAPVDMQVQLKKKETTMSRNSLALQKIELPRRQKRSLEVSCTQMSIMLTSQPLWKQRFDEAVNQSLQSRLITKFSSTIPSRRNLDTSTSGILLDGPPF